MKLRALMATAVAASLLSGAAMAQEVVRFATIFDAAQVERWTPVVEEYESLNPGVDIQLETTAGSGAAVYPDVLRTSMASGDPPDLFFMWGGSLAEPYITAGQTLDIAKYYKQYGWAERFPQWIKDRLSVNGVLYGVPYHARGMGFWYKKSTLANLNLTEPKTYAELEALCTTLSENGKYCASFGGKFGWHTMRLVDYFIEDVCGPEIHDAINNRTQSWNQECVVASFDRLKQWVDKKWLVPDFLTVAPNDARMPVYLDQAAFDFEGGWFEGVLKSDEQPSEDYAFFAPPTGSGRYTAFPEQWMIPKNAKNPDGAAKFIDFITTAAVENKYPDAFEGSATIGVTPNCTVLPHACKWSEILSSSAGTYPPLDQAFPKELMDSFFEAQDAVIAGRMSSVDAAALIQTRIEQFGK